MNISVSVFSFLFSFCILDFTWRLCHRHGRGPSSSRCRRSQNNVRFRLTKLLADRGLQIVDYRLCCTITGDGRPVEMKTKKLRHPCRVFLPRALGALHASPHHGGGTFSMTPTPTMSAGPLGWLGCLPVGQ